MGWKDIPEPIERGWLTNVNVDRCVSWTADCERQAERTRVRRQNSPLPLFLHRPELPGVGGILAEPGRFGKQPA